jgi:Flp pilus assembly protein TadB
MAHKERRIFTGWFFTYDGKTKKRDFMSFEAMQRWEQREALADQERRLKAAAKEAAKERARQERERERRERAWAREQEKAQARQQTGRSLPSKAPPSVGTSDRLHTGTTSPRGNRSIRAEKKEVVETPWTVGTALVALVGVVAVGFVGLLVFAFVGYVLFEALPALFGLF